MPGALARRLSQLVFGGRCFVCRGDAGDLLCAACDAELPRAAGPRCPRCALASPAGDTCGRCLAHPPRFDATVAALEYAFPADALVMALKFRAELSLAPLLGVLLSESLAGRAPPDLVAPVPLAAARLRARGFNQALEVARSVCNALGVRLEPRLAERTRDTPPQLDLPHDARARNVRGAFACAVALDGARVAVVDDVMTTGATLDELAATLKRAGAAHVENWVVARTPAPADA